MENRPVTRRQMLKMSGVTAMGLAMAACQPKVVEVEKVVTQEVEKIVEKEVKETVVVTEKEIQVVTPTPRPRVAGEHVTLRYGTFWPMWRIEILNKGLKIFEEQHPDISVAVEIGGGQFRDKLTTQFAAGTEPDTGITNVYDMQRFYDAGLCLDMMPYVEAAGIDLEADYALQGVEFSGGHLYGMPWVTFGHGIVYNKTIFKEYGVPDPHDDLGGYWTWDQFESAMRTIKEASEGKVFPIDISLNSVTYHLPEFIYGRCGRLYDFPSMSYTLNEPATVAALEEIVRLYEEGLIIDAESRNATALAGMLDTFSGEAVAMRKDSTGIVRSTLDNVADKFEWDIARCPTINGTADESMSFISADPNFASANTPYRDEAATLLLFLAGDDMQNILSQHKMGNPSLKRAHDIEGGFKTPPPDHIGIMLEPWYHGRAISVMFHYNANACNKIMGREMDYVIVGDKTVKEACDTMQKDCTEQIEYKTPFVPQSQWLIDFPSSWGACAGR